MSLSVLVLCTGNSARSILAECLFNRLGEGRINAVSAGSSPTGSVNPFALELLEAEGFDVTTLRSKSWDEFADDGFLPGFDLVVTVCDSAASETCPVWPGHPVTAHWGLPDPAAVNGSDEDKRAAFRATYEALTTRIRDFLALDWDRLTDTDRRIELKRIATS